MISCNAKLVLIKEKRMKETIGDLVKMAKRGEFDVIVHGCNCFHTMGAGIARQIKEELPEAFSADLNTQYMDRFKLGTYSKARIERNGHEFVVVNAYTQFGYGQRFGKSDADLRAIRACFVKIKRDFSGLRIGYPKIGGGLAGGDWNKISAIINEVLEGEDHTLVIFQAVQK